MKKYDTVIFDLDGTLLDTLDDLADSVNEALLIRGYPLRTRDEVRRFVGNGVRRLISRCVPGGDGDPGFEACLDDFKRLYDLNKRRRTTPYDGILGLLERLSLAGVKLAVVSNKPDAAVRELCSAYFGARITVAFGESDVLPRKPSPESVRAALLALGSGSDRAVYVGDSEVDILTAENAGLDFIGAAWGFRGRDALVEAGARQVIDAPAELLRLVILP